jgi:hypothetical protein
VADEAVLRIVLQDSSGGGSVPTSQAPTSIGADTAVDTSTPAGKSQYQPPSQRTAYPTPPKPQPFKPEPSGLDEILKVVDGLRGTIGGYLGPIIGATIDAVSGFRKAQIEAERQKYEAQDQPPPEQVTAGNIPMVQPAYPVATRPQATGILDPAEDMMSGAAMAVPIIGAALAAKKVAEEINKAIIGGIKDVIGGAGSIASSIASPNADPSVPIYQLSDAASRAGEELTKYVPVLGYMTVATGEAGKALAGLMQNLDKTAQRYGEYSPEIAQAQAYAEIRQTMGDFRRAQESASELARYVYVQADLQQKFEDIKIKLLNQLLPIVTGILETLEAIMPSGEGIENAVGTLAGPLNGLAASLGVIASLTPNPNDHDVLDPTDTILTDRVVAPFLDNPRGA